MTDFFQWLSGSAISSIVFIIAISVILVVLVPIYTIAFFQGREISFWPPKIGQKPMTPVLASELKTKIESETIDIPQRIAELEKQLNKFAKQKESTGIVFQPKLLPDRVKYLLEIQLHFDTKIKELVLSYSGGWAGVSIAPIEVFISYLNTHETEHQEIRLLRNVIEIYAALREILEGYTISPTHDIDDSVFLYIQYLASQLERKFQNIPFGPLHHPASFS